MNASCFVTGTDTGVGKTRVALELVRLAAAAGLRVGVMKPVAAGWVARQHKRNDDALALQAAANVQLPYELVNPVCLESPTSPHLAARRQGTIIDVSRVVQAFREIESRCDIVIVEGAGGWLAPIVHGRAVARAVHERAMAREADGRTLAQAHELAAPKRPAEGTMQDVAVALGLPVMLVAGIRLGCLSHALLTAAAVSDGGLPLAGWVANHIDPGFADAADYIETLTARLGGPPHLVLPFIG